MRVSLVEHLPRVTEPGFTVRRALWISKAGFPALSPPPTAGLVTSDYIDSWYAIKSLQLFHYWYFSTAKNSIHPDPYNKECHTTDLNIPLYVAIAGGGGWYLSEIRQNKHMHISFIQGQSETRSPIKHQCPVTWRFLFYTPPPPLSPGVSSSASVIRSATSSRKIAFHSIPCPIKVGTAHYPQPGFS